MRLTPLFLALLLSGPSSAATIVLDFTSPAPGEYDELVYPEVRLSEWTADRGLGISTPGGGPPVLRVGDQGGTLLLEFTAAVVGVSITFGGDSDNADVEARPAVLVGIAGGTFVDIAAIDPNRNDLIDQTLTINEGVVLEQALFYFRQLGPHQPLSPLIGSITLTTQDVPEPGVAALLLAAVALGLARVRSRSRAGRA